MDSTEKELTMTFDPKTIEHLGIKMYSQLPNAIAELIANAFDACASKVFINLIDNDEGKKIIVEDNGDGMSFDEVNDKFLVIGRNRREEGESVSSCGRIATGKKGLGKLAFFGIGKTITIETCKDNIKTVFALDWDELLKTSGEPYKPRYTLQDCNKDEKGTTITLTNLKRKSDFDVWGLSRSLAKLFNFPDDFIVLLQLNDEEIVEITNKLKYEDIKEEFLWNLPEWLIQNGLTDYEKHNEINGKIITTEKPLKPGMRGITLFANGRMVNRSEFFGSSESSHFFSYTTGWLDIDFVDNWEQDVISTNRQSLDWENSKTRELRDFLTKMLTEIHKDWREKRKEKRREKVKEITKINVPDWLNKVPENIRNRIDSLLKSIDNSELSGSEQSNVVNNLHLIVPDYPYFHWRQLHPIIQAAAETDYKNRDYYRAFIEAAKRFITETRKKSKSVNHSDQSMMGEVYGYQKTLSVTKKYKKPDGTNFPLDTLKSIEDGQKYLSMGIVAGGRNPISHEEIKDLRDSDLFSEKDCLDGLSLLSHLMKRLENSEKI
jgi:uncharacterized protein (TIGR02391 family)